MDSQVIPCKDLNYKIILHRVIKLKNKLVSSFANKELIKAAENEPITNDGGLGNIGREIRQKVESGEIESLTNKELIDYHMSIVKLSGNQKLINMSRVAVTKKTRRQLIDMVKLDAKLALKHSAKEEE